MRLRDHNKGDLALAALTLSVSIVAVGSEAARWASRHFRRTHRPAHAPGPPSKRRPRS